MTQDNTLSIKLSNSQLNKSKSGIKNGIEVILNLSSYTQVLQLPKPFPNNSSPNKKLSKTQLSKMVQLGRYMTIFCSTACI